jgi:lipoprotein-anchoring transpeptidase ErfK/SrfK
MIFTLRAGILAGTAIALALPLEAQAQSRTIWDELFGAPTRPSEARSSTQRMQPSQRRQAAADDDDDDAPQRAQRSQSPRGSAAGRGSLTRGPAVMDGGGRPAIAPSAPPVVAYTGGHAPGTVVIDTNGRALYYVLSGGRAYRYPIAVGRIGFSWTGTQRVTRVASWPDWRPPAEMRQRQPHLPQLMTGGVRNPLGAKALYLGSTLYRIHGTNDVRSIGTASSSGCFRMTNSHVTHLASMAGVGTTVHVMRGLPGRRNIAGPAGGRPRG